MKLPGLEKKKKKKERFCTGQSINGLLGPFYSSELYLKKVKYYMEFVCTERIDANIIALDMILQSKGYFIHHRALY